MPDTWTPAAHGPIVKRFTIGAAPPRRGARVDDGAHLRIHGPPPLALLPRARGGRGRGQADDLVAPARRARGHHLGAGAQGPLVLRLVRPPRARLQRRPPARRDPRDPRARPALARGAWSARATSAPRCSPIAASPSRASTSSRSSIAIPTRIGRGSATWSCATSPSCPRGGERRFEIGVIATPLRAAQEVADALVAAGVRGILNFAPRKLFVPAHVALRTVDMTMEFESLSFALTPAPARAPAPRRRRRDRRDAAPPRAAAAVAARWCAATLLWGGTFVVDPRQRWPRSRRRRWCAARFGAAALLCRGRAASAARPPADRATRWIGGASPAAARPPAATSSRRSGSPTPAPAPRRSSPAPARCSPAFFAWPLLRQRPGPRARRRASRSRWRARRCSRCAAGCALGRGRAGRCSGAALYALQIVAVARFAPRADPLALAGDAGAGGGAACCCRSPGAPAARSRALDGTAGARIAYLAVAGSIDRAAAPGARAAHAARRAASGCCSRSSRCSRWCSRSTLGGERFAPRWWLGRRRSSFARW